ncbi:MAG: hypothetical protein ACXACO_08160 [Promethearchaeota archaeon]
MKDRALNLELDHKLYNCNKERKTRTQIASEEVLKIMEADKKGGDSRIFVERLRIIITWLNEEPVNYHSCH